MRWDKLFDDLESQLEREISAEELDLGAEEERLRLGRLSVRDRLVGIHEAGDVGYVLGVTLANGERMSLHPVTFGRDWFSADVVDDSARRRQCLVPIAAISGLSLLPSQLGASLARGRDDDGHPALADRLGLSFVLRDLCRRRRAVDVVLARSVLHGTIDRVGRDHLDLAVHEAGRSRRDSEVLELRVVALSALVLLRL
jgi:hypothetical protein